MSTLYDEIMDILHEAGEFSKSAQDGQMANSVVHAQRMVESEFSREPMRDPLPFMLSRAGSSLHSLRKNGSSRCQ